MARAKTSQQHDSLRTKEIHKAGAREKYDIEINRCWRGISRLFIKSILRGRFQISEYLFLNIKKVRGKHALSNILKVGYLLI